MIKNIAVEGTEVIEGRKTDGGTVKCSKVDWFCTVLLRTGVPYHLLLVNPSMWQRCSRKVYEYEISD